MWISDRSWGNDTKKLEFGTSFEGFQVWKARALMFLSRDRPDVRKLLLWAEVQSKEGLEAGLIAEAMQLGMSDLDSVEYAPHDGCPLYPPDAGHEEHSGTTRRGILKRKTTLP